MSLKKVYDETESFAQMINWLKITKVPMSGLQFDVFLISENQKVANDFLQDACLFSYRTDSFLKNRFSSCTHLDIIQYIEENVIPACKTQIDQNVRNGDFGEIVVAMISQYIYKQRPFKKMRFKLNNKKSAFGTDVISFDNMDNPRKISFFESKVKVDLLKKVFVKKGIPAKYISVVAYESLSYDFTSATQPMLDFMAQRFDDEGNEELSKKYIELSTSYRKINAEYEIFLLTELKKPLPDYKCLFDALNQKKINLNPLKLTIVLIDDMQTLINDVWNGCAQRAVDLYG